ncbi:DDB1- and CUL4-associated factor 11 [Phlebotomus argentipes]|uniref:DDB1- and CUL4-associated factor 11 n=1 Tax=Phlebotomus argentipes TaxID=94469 RepID=UPI0028937370|nr:DDB1- and CUL4-associated factor 11 [Phlebotomus argentipes]
MEFMETETDEEEMDSDSDYEPILNSILFHDRESGYGGYRGSSNTRRSYILLVLQNLVGSGLIEYEGDGFARKLPKIQGKQTTDALVRNDFYQSVMRASGQTARRQPWNVAQMLSERQHVRSWTTAQKCKMSSLYVPNVKEGVAMKYDSKVFCGSFTPNGKHFVTACQEGEIRVYDATASGIKPGYKLVNTLLGRDVEWSILDMDFTPDGQEFVYATRSCCLHVGNLHGRSSDIMCIPFDEYSMHKFASYSVQFANGGRELIAGCSDGAVSVYDRDRCAWTERALEDNMEVNAVRLLEGNSHILCAGSDDGTIRIYDRRAMAVKSRGSVGMFVGHLDGVTSIDVKNDGRYFITNSKDQTIKLWDVRVTSKESQIQEFAAGKRDAFRDWDYRWNTVPPSYYKVNELPGDTSVMSYRGHRVFKSLIRAKFSPASTTGQRYIYTGCGTGYLVMYDALTGEMVQAIRGHSNIVRDVAWHPHRSEILTSSWDCNVNLYSYKAEGWKKENKSARSGVTLRRSLRIANRNRRNQSDIS